MRLALISDLHGNELALEAVLHDARLRGYDLIVCLGDVVTLGPRPSAVLARLRELKCPCILGNHDEFMLDPALVHSYTKFHTVVDSVEATRQALSAEEVAFLGTFRRTLRFDDVFLYHGTPQSNTRDLLVTTPPETVDEMLGDTRALVFAGGHTHLPMLRQHRGSLLVNPGSVGQPFREHTFGAPPIILPHAEYALVDIHPEGISVDLRRIALEKRALAAQVEGWDNPLADSLRQLYS